MVARDTIKEMNTTPTTEKVKKQLSKKSIWATYPEKPISNPLY
jgi:hypothetical protein